MIFALNGRTMGAYLGDISLSSLKKERKKLKSRLREEENLSFADPKRAKALRASIRQLDEQIRNYEQYTPTEREVQRDRRQANQSRASITRTTPVKNVQSIKSQLRRHRIEYQKAIKEMPAAEKDQILMRENEAYRSMAGDVPAHIREYMLENKVYSDQIYRAMNVPGAKVDSPLWQMYKDRARKVKTQLRQAEQYLERQAVTPYVPPSLMDIYRQVGNRVAENNPGYGEQEVQQSVARYVAGKAAGGGAQFGPPSAPGGQAVESSYATAEAPQEKKSDLPGWLVPIAAAGLILLGAGG